MSFLDLFGQGAGDFLSAQGEFQAASILNQAAQVGQQMETLEGVSGKLQEQQQRRAMYQITGQQVGAASGNNLATAGSARSIIFSSQGQGALKNQLIGVQTGIQQEGTQIQVLQTEAEAAQAEATGQAQEAAGFGSILGGIGGLAGLLFSDRRLKRDITFHGYVKGIPFYFWRWKWGHAWHYGPIAQEVREIFPEFVRRGPFGLLMVDMRRLMYADN